MDPVDFVAGSLSGALSQLFGHPFDTIKVRMQTSPEIYNRGVLQSFRLILAREGPLAFFQGACAVSDVIISTIVQVPCNSRSQPCNILNPRAFSAQ